MTQNRAPILACLALALAAGCGNDEGNGNGTVTLPFGINGNWTGILDGATLIQIDMLEQPSTDPSGAPIILVSGLGSLTLGGCTDSISASGFRDILGYVVTLTGTGTNTFTIELVGQLTDGVFDGTFVLTDGGLTEACLKSFFGPFEMGRTVVDGVNGTFNGNWTGANSLSFRTSQAGDNVYGEARWSGYTCARDAFFTGVRTGDTVQGTMTPLLGSLTSYDVTFDWDASANGSMSGSFTVTAVAPGSPCVSGDMGSFALDSISNAKTGAGGSALSLTVLEVDPEGEASVMYRYEERTE